MVTKTFTIKEHAVTKNVLLDSDGNYKYVHYSILNDTTNVSSSESVVMSLERISSSNVDTPFGQSVVLSQSFDVNDTEIMLTPGKYSVDIQLLDHAGVVIPKNCKIVCVDYSANGKRCKETNTIPEDNIVINPAPLGGVVFNNKTFFYVSASDLSEDNVLEFNIIKMPNPRCLDDMDDFSNIGNVSEQYHTILIPKFVPKE